MFSNVLECSRAGPKGGAPEHSRALPTETKVESGTSQSKSGTSVNLSKSGEHTGDDLRGARRSSGRTAALGSAAGPRFGVWGLGFGVWGLGFGVWGLEIGLGLGFRFSGLGLGLGACDLRSLVLEFGVWRLRFGVWELGLGGWGLGPGLGVWGLGFGVWGLGFGVWCLGFGV